MKKSLFALLLVCTMILSLLAGCGSATSTQAETASPSETEPAQAVSSDHSAEAAEAPAEENTAEAAGSAAAPTEPEAAAPEEMVPSYEKYAVSLPLSEDGATVSMYLLLPPFITAMVDSPSDLAVLHALGERTGLTLDITAGNYLDGSTVINLMIATGSYCDVINHIDLYASGLDAAVENEVVIDLSDYILNDMPNLMASLTAYDDDVIKQMTTASGYIAYFPQIHAEPYVDNFTIGVQANLMEELGIAEPATFEELHDLLAAVNQAYGLQYGMRSDGFDQALLCGYNITTGQVGLEGLRVVDGEVQFSGITDEMYRYIAMIQQWYSEGLIFNDFISYEDFEQTNMVAAGTLFGNGNVNAQTINEANANGISVKALHFVTPSSGEALKIRGSGEIIRTPSWSVSTQCDEETLGYIISLVEYLYSDEGTILFNYGIEDEAYILDANGEPQWSDLIMNYEGGTTTAAMIYATATPSEYLPGIYDDAKFNFSYTDVMLEADDIINHSSTGEYDYPIGADNRISAEDTLTAANLASDISTYVSETVLSWIHGGTELNEFTWQTYKDNCFAMGLQDVLDIYQAGYDAFMAN